jgi:hypothetical protein
MVGLEVLPVRTTGPILAIGGITVANRVILNDKPFDWKVPVATGITAGAFVFLEKAWEEAAVMLAWTAVVAVLLTRLDPGVPSPVESLNRFLNKR